MWGVVLCFVCGVMCVCVCVCCCVLSVVLRVVVVVVVVVRTLCLYDVSVHATQLLAMNSGGRSPESQTPGDPATLPSPNGGGKPWPCACAQP